MNNLNKVLKGIVESLKLYISRTIKETVGEGTLETSNKTIIGAINEVNRIKSSTGGGLPSGGRTGQVLAKKSNTGYDVEWKNETTYTHPVSHPATMITEDSTHRFVTDAEKNKWNNITTSESDLSKIAIVCGDKLSSDISDSERIQRAINSSNVGDIILLPKGDIEIHKTIELKPNRTYMGNGWGGSIKASDNANLTEMIRLPHSTNNYRTIIDNIRLDGNKDNNGTTIGLYIGSSVHSVFRNVYATYCKGTGIYIDGNTSFRSNTTNIINCRALGCGGYGLYISEYCEDMHVLQGDYGSNQNPGIYIKSPSSSIRDVTCWGNMSNGLWIDINAVCVQVWNSQIEGNAQNGIFIEGAFAEIVGNKIYDNANIPANYGKFDGIYVNAYESAFKDAPMKGVTIIGNKVYSGLYNNTGLQRFALSIDKYHEGFSIFGNDFFYQGNGNIDNSRTLVNGLNETDKSDYNWIKSFIKLNLLEDQAITNSTVTKLKFTKVTDLDENFDSTTNKIKIKESGYYRIGCNIHVDNCSATTYCYLQYNVNDEIKSRIAGGYGGTSNFLTLSGDDVVYMETGDTIDFSFYCSENVTLNRLYYLSSITFSKYVI